jgi:mRNA interferase RelE/StbE
MKVKVQKSFEKDILKITNSSLAQKVLHIIAQIEQAKELSEIPHFKKLKTEGNFFSIRLGNFRLGLKLEQETIILLRIMDRKDIYKFFP